MALGKETKIGNVVLPGYNRPQFVRWDYPLGFGVRVCEFADAAHAKTNEKPISETDVMLTKDEAEELHELVCGKLYEFIKKRDQYQGAKDI